MKDKPLKNADCKKLDDYLVGDLMVDEREGFQQHLSECTACDEAVSTQRWIDELLRREASEQQASEFLENRIQTEIVRKRRRQWLGRTAVAAAAGLLGLVFWLPKEETPVQPLAPDLGKQVATAIEEAPSSNEPEATFVGDSDMIVIPVDSPSSNVTIVEVYPTTSAKRRWEREALLSSSNTFSNGG